MASQTLFLIMSIPKKILIIANNSDVALALKGYILSTSKMDVEFVKALTYDSFRASLRNFDHYDYIICELFKLYGIRERAEGVITAKTFYNFNKKILIYDFNMPQVQDNQIIWDVFDESKSLDDALECVVNLSDEEYIKNIEHLEAYFSDAFFGVDGH